MLEETPTGKVNVCPVCGNPFPDEILLTPRHARGNGKECDGSGKKLKEIPTIVVRAKSAVLHLFNR